MITSRVKSDPASIAVIVGLVGVIYILDILTPMGVTVAILYVAPVYMAGWLPLRSVGVVVAVACIGLTFLSLAFSSSGGIPWIILANRGLAVAAIWAALFLAFHHRRTQSDLKLLQGLLPTCASCKKIRDAQGDWHRIEAYIEEHSEAQFTHGICPECRQKLYPDLNEAWPQ